MKEIISKRLIFLTKTYVLITALSVVSLLGKIDSRDLYKDISTLETIKKVKETYNTDTMFEQNPVFKKASEWLAKANPALSKKNQDARQNLVDKLISLKVGEEEIRSIKGNHSEGQVFSLIGFNLKKEDESIRKNYYDANTVGEVIKNFVVLTSTNELKVVTSISENNLNTLKKQDSFPLLKRVLLKDGQVELIFMSKPQYSPAQNPYLENKQYLPANVEKIAVPSILSLLEDKLDEFYVEQTQLERIGSIYGKLPIDTAITLVNEDFVRAYKSVDLLGFKFSARRFPFAIASFCLLIALGIFWNLRIAKLGSLRVFSEVHNEDVIDVLIHDRRWRIALWVVFPILAIYLSYPPFPLSNLEKFLLITGSLVIGCLGVLSLIQARDL